jgi:hypothetical protein
MTQGTGSEGLSRSLGTWEDLIYEGERLHTSFLTVVNRFTLRCRAKIEEYHVRNALVKIMQRFPMLRMGVITKLDNGSSQPTKWFAEVEKNVPNLERVATADVDYVAEQELATNFESDKPLWRIKMFPLSEHDDEFEQKFIFSFHHCVIDGASIMRIMQSFLDNLELELRDLAADETGSLPLMPSRDVLFREKMLLTTWDKIRMKVDAVVCDVFRLADDPIAQLMQEYFKPALILKSTTCSVNFHLTQDETKSVISNCKERGLKVNGAITAAATVALRRLLLRHHVIEQLQSISIRTEFYVNLRRTVVPVISDDHIGLHMTHCNLPITVKPGQTFWDIAAACHRDVKKKIRNGVHFSEAKEYNREITDLGLQNYLNLCTSSNKRQMSFYISNMGSWDLKVTPNIATEPLVYFKEMCQVTADPVETCDAPVFAHNVYTINGELFWCMGYSTNVTKQDIAEEYVRLVRESLLEYMAV